MQITDIAYRVPLPKTVDRTTSIDLKCIVTKLINYGVQKSNTGTNGSVIEGVQQPYEISIVTGIQQARDITLFCTVYPNPATDLLTLEVEIADNENLFYQLYGIKGMLLVRRPSFQWQISLLQLIF